MDTVNSKSDSLLMLLRLLKLPAFIRYAEEVAQTAERQNWTFGQYLHHLAELEVQERRSRRITRNLKASGLPQEKTLATFDKKKMSSKVARMLPTLCNGQFVERGDNLLIFGLPGRGKTHLACAVGHELVQQGRRVLFTPTYALVQRLLAAKRDLRLEKFLASLDSFEAVILDDIGYVQQDRDEMEVLFTFLAERYERKTVVITSNLVFSAWDRIFKDPMTTAAAIDRLVHHAVIVEMVGRSIRVPESDEKPPTDTSSTRTESLETSAMQATAPTTASTDPPRLDGLLARHVECRGSDRTVQLAWSTRRAQSQTPEGHPWRTPCPLTANDNYDATTTTTLSASGRLAIPAGSGGHRAGQHRTTIRTAPQRQLRPAVATTTEGDRDRKQWAVGSAKTRNDQPMDGEM